MSYQVARPGRAGLGFSYDPVAWATKIQAGANRLTANLNLVSGKIQQGQVKLNTGVDAVTGLTMKTGQVVQAVSRAGIATGATGDASSGLALASASTKGTLVLAGLAAAIFVFARHPGKRGW